jgi:cytolysin (calcineurin-like family phosphatase)
MSSQLANTCTQPLAPSGANPIQKARQTALSIFKNLLAFGLFAFLLLGVQGTLAAQDNIAKLKPAKQSSILGNNSGYGPQYANDGVIQNTGGAIIMCTQKENNPWWEVDLEDNYTITEIKVHNRINCCPDRLDNFTILVSDKPFTGNSGGTVFAQNRPMPPSADGIGSYSGNIPGRYVRIFLNGNNHLSIPEIEIFGTKTLNSKGTVVIHNEGTYDLRVFVGAVGTTDQAVGEVLQKNRLPLRDINRGEYLRFQAYDRNGPIDGVNTKPVYLWNVDNHDYYVSANEPADLAKAFAMDPNLYGINIGSLDPRNIAKSQLKSPIFKRMDGNTVDYKVVARDRLIKEGFKYGEDRINIGSESQNVRYKSESVKNSWSINVDLKGSVPVKGVKVDAGVGIGYKEYDQTDKEKKDVYIEKSQWEGLYTVSCDSLRADLATEFKVVVNKLPLDYNDRTKGEYKNFVEKYGTHFLSEVSYGGFSNSFVSMSENTFNNIQGNSLDVKTELAISAKVQGQDVGGSLGVAYAKTHEETLKEHFKDMYSAWERNGGEGKFDDWKVSEADVVPVIIKPQVISELIRPEVFKDDSDFNKLSKIKINLEDYLLEYMDGLPKKFVHEAPPVVYNLEILDIKVVEYKDDGDATQKADIDIKAYSGELSRLRAEEPQVDFRKGDVDKRLVREMGINPPLNQPLSLVDRKIGLVVKRGNPDKRVFKIVGKFKEYDSNFGGTPEEWVASGYIETDLTDSEPDRTGQLQLNHSRVRWGSKQQFDVVVNYKLTRTNDYFDIPEGAQVIPNNLTEQFSSRELVTDPAVNPSKKITLRQKGAYVAKYTIEYTVDGRLQTIPTGNVTVGNEDTYNIPADAINVKVKAEGATGLVWAPWTTHFEQTYPKAVTRIIESLGTTLNQSYRELDGEGKLLSQGSSPPPPSNEKRITLRNKGGYIAKYTIQYTLNGQTKTINDDGVLAGQEKVHDISADATNVTIQAQGATGLVWEPWVTHFKQTYQKIESRIIESYGTTLNQSYKELNETGGLVSQGNTPPPPADSKRITFKNRAAYTARYTLTYSLQGKPVEERSGNITAGRDKVYDVPRVATNVEILAEGATGLAWEPWRKHFNKKYPTASDITIESKGTTLNQSAKEN